MSDTPETDAYEYHAFKSESDLAYLSRRLERELAEANKQRDEYKNRLESYVDRNALLHSKLEKEKETSELLAESRDNWEKVSIELECELAESNKQRDRLAKAMKELVAMDDNMQNCEDQSYCDAYYAYYKGGYEVWEEARKALNF